MTQTKNELYFAWLCHLIERRREDEPGKLTLITFMQNTEFVPIVPNDDNRAADGLKLREQYCRKKHWENPEECWEGPCTILEMLVALALRMGYMLDDIDEETQTAKWFWVLVGNLKLHTHDCDDPEAERKDKMNQLILKKLVERTYDETGKGGLFPLKHADVDQRRVEIWYQLMCYIKEKRL